MIAAPISLRLHGAEITVVELKCLAGLAQAKTRRECNLELAALDALAEIRRAADRARDELGIRVEYVRFGLAVEVRP
jgi:hypothetical protein